MKLGRADSYYQETKFGQRVSVAASATVPLFQGRSRSNHGGKNLSGRTKPGNQFNQKFSRYVLRVYVY